MKTWKKNLPRVGYTSVFRDYKGEVLVGAFSSNLDILSSIAIEEMTVVKTMELAWVVIIFDHQVMT